MKTLQYLGKTELIKRRQRVEDIVSELLDAHMAFADQYDSLASSFDRGSVKEICDALVRWCKQNIRYKVESEDKQTTKSPAAMLAQGQGDCKHYASFCGGVLDALNRKGRRISWAYRFASYNIFNRTPEHVFVVVKSQGREHWLDPTPGADKARPVWLIDKKISAMPLYRISGAPAVPEYPISRYIEQVHRKDSPELLAAVEMLLRYGVMDPNAQCDDVALANLEWTLPEAEYAALVQARRTVQGAVIGGLFGDVWRGVKKVGLSPARNAFLAMVAFNGLGWATKLSRAIYNDDGTRYQPGYDRLKKKWESLGGNFSKLENTIRSGARKRAILGSAAVPAWALAASAIIAAIGPIVADILKSKSGGPQIEMPVLGDDPMPPVQNTGGGVMEWVRQNPLLAAAAAGATIYFFAPKRRTS